MKFTCYLKPYSSESGWGVNKFRFISALD